MMETNVLVDRTFTVGDAEITIRDIPAVREGDHLSVEDDVMERVIASVAIALASNGYVSPESFRYLRRALKLRALDVANLFHVRQATVSDWETGKAVVPRAAWGVLAAAVLHGSETLDPLRKEPRGRQTVSERFHASVQG